MLTRENLNSTFAKRTLHSDSLRKGRRLIKNRIIMINCITLAIVAAARAEKAVRYILNDHPDTTIITEEMAFS